MVPTCRDMRERLGTRRRFFTKKRKKEEDFLFDAIAINKKREREMTRGFSLQDSDYLSPTRPF